MLLQEFLTQNKIERVVTIPVQTSKAAGETTSDSYWQETHDCGGE